MLEKFKNIFSGVLTYEQLIDISISHIEFLLSDEEALEYFDIGLFSTNNALYERWKDFLLKDL